MLNDQELLAQLKARLPEIADHAQDRLLAALLDDAAAVLRALTWRDAVPEALQNAQVRLAVILFGRVGIEGERAHTEGEVSRVLSDLPDALRREITAHRVAKT